MTEAESFSARSYEWRLHSDEEAIERHLPTEVARAPRRGDQGTAGARRAFVIASPSIAAHTSTIDRIADALGDRYAGAFAGIEVDSTYRSVAAATDAARAVTSLCCRL